MFESEHYGVRTHIRLESGNHLKNIRSLLLSEQFAYKFSRDVAFEIQNRVKTAVEGMTGLKVVAVNVHVQGVNTEAATEEKEEQSSDEENK